MEKRYTRVNSIQNLSLPQHKRKISCRSSRLKEALIAEQTYKSDLQKIDRMRKQSCKYCKIIELEVMLFV